MTWHFFHIHSHSFSSLLLLLLPLFLLPHHPIPDFKVLLMQKLVEFFLSLLYPPWRHMFFFGIQYLQFLFIRKRNIIITYKTCCPCRHLCPVCLLTGHCVFCVLLLTGYISQPFFIFHCTVWEYYLEWISPHNLPLELIGQSWSISLKKHYVDTIHVPFTNSQSKACIDLKIK